MKEFSKQWKWAKNPESWAEAATPETIGASQPTSHLLGVSMSDKYEGILRSLNPKGFGFLNSQTATGVEVYYFASSDAVENKVVIGLRATFHVDLTRQPGRHPHAVEIELADFPSVDSVTEDGILAQVQPLSGEVKS
jgi:hypothetical protein